MVAAEPEIRGARRRGRHLLWLFAVFWAATGVWLYVQSSALIDTHWILAGFTFGGYWLVGFILFATCYRPIAKRPGSLVGTAIVVASAYAMLTFDSQMADFGKTLRFQTQLGRYREIVRKVEQTPALQTDELHADGDARYLVDKGPPVRVAFVWGGVIGNWYGVVHDPTGAVESAPGGRPAAGDFTASLKPEKLFGDDVVACRVLTKPFYLCAFT